MILEINTSQYEKLDRSFYQDSDVVKVARKLIGKYLITRIHSVVTIGKIIETEAYCGRNDKACHASKGRTPRTEVMFGQGGHAYVYLCYGIHHLFNVVTNQEGQADAVLIRALEPVEGLEEMRQRRFFVPTNRKLTAGPGILSQAMGIRKQMTGYDLLGETIWIAEGDAERFEIEVDVRIGIEYAEEDALKPWRFLMKGNKYLSKNKKARVD